MSYDFYLAVNIGNENDPQPLSKYDNLNYTYNVSPMYVEAFRSDDGVWSIDNLTCRNADILIKEAICNMKKDPEKYKSMNPENGWGNYAGALKTLEILHKWCLDCPNAIVRIS